MRATQVKFDWMAIMRRMTSRGGKPAASIDKPLVGRIVIGLRDVGREDVGGAIVELSMLKNHVEGHCSHLEVDSRAGAVLGGRNEIGRLACRMSGGEEAHEEAVHRRQQGDGSK